MTGRKYETVSANEIIFVVLTVIWLVFVVGYRHTAVVVIITSILWVVVGVGLLTTSPRGRKP